MDVNREPLRVLLVEDNAMDAELVLHQLRDAGFDPKWSRVESEPDYLAALEPTLDLIVSDFNLPQFDALRALDLLNAADVDVPLLVVSGSIGEETAVRLLKQGAADYLLKDRLARLGQAVRRVLDERRLRLANRETERALSATQARMRFAMEASQVGFWEADLKTGITEWSETLEALHGLPSGGFPGTFEAFLDRVHDDDRQQVAETIERATRQHNDSNLLYRTEWPDGTIRWISGIGRTFYDETGTPVRATGISFDVTERRTLEEQYRQAQKMEAIGQLAGGVAHDFNNILTAIKGFCELLDESSGLQELHHSDLAQIRLAADRATSLTRQLLAFGRRQILEPRVIDLRDSLTSMTPMLERLIGRHIQVVVRTPPDLGRVKADPGQMEQIVLNLAINARDAMPHGGTLILEVEDVQLDETYARQHAALEAGRYVMVAVSDTGTGMDAATQARIFEPFFTTKPAGQGTGLGLSTVYGIVKQSGGDIWVYSEPGHGTTFKVYFPRVDEEVDTPANHSTPASLRGSETILVVEDEPAVRELVRRSLENYGYQVLLSSQPSEALDIASEDTAAIDMLLSDMMLPQMSGNALAERIVARHPDIRVLFMSGYTDSAIVHNGALDRGTPFLQKPFAPETLVRKVREVLG